MADSLSRALSDLYAKEGSGGGWEFFTIRGAATNPAGVRLTPAGPGESFVTNPNPTVAFTSLTALTPLTRVQQLGPGDGPVTFVATQEGVNLRLLADGTVLDAVGVPATTGPLTRGESEAIAIADKFVADNIGDSSLQRSETRTISHREGDALTRVSYRTVRAGRPASEQVVIEVDRRSGAVVYFTHAQGTPSTTEFEVTAEQAIATASATTGQASGVARASADIWDQARWLVIIDNGLHGRPDALVPAVTRVYVDATTGAVLQIETT